nr:hypothetical protein [Tanacetum cinerariifolium]
AVVLALRLLEVVDGAQVVARHDVGNAREIVGGLFSHDATVELVALRVGHLLGTGCGGGEVRAVVDTSLVGFQEGQGFVVDALVNVLRLFSHQ